MAERHCGAEMKWTFWGSQSRDYEKEAIEALKTGLNIRVQSISDFQEPEGGGAIVMSLQHKRRTVMDAYLAKGLPVIFLDKGYIAPQRAAHRISHWRIAVNGTQPTSYMMRTERPADRLDLIREEFHLSKPHKGASNIVIAGSSTRYHVFHGLPEPDVYAAQLVEDLKRFTDKPVIYRPKPKSKGVGPVEGAGFDHNPVVRRAYLTEAYAVMTHGSNAAVDAVLAGVPVFVLGDHPASHMGKRWPNEIMSPKFIRHDEREVWLRNLAYCQWGFDEMKTRAFWDYFEPTLHEERVYLSNETI